MPEEVEKAYAGNPLIGEIAVLEQAGDLVALVVPDIEEVRKRGTERIADLVREELEFCARRMPSAQRLAGHVTTREALPRTALGKLRRHLLADRYRRARDGEAPRTAAALSPEDLALIERVPGREIWDWLGRRFPGHTLDLDTSPQLDLGIDSLGWIGLGMEIEQRFGIRLAETRIARIVTLRDLLREAIDAAGDEQPVAAAATRPRSRMMVAFAHVLHFLDRLGMRVLFHIRIEGADR